MNKAELLHIVNQHTCIFISQSNQYADAFPDLLAYGNKKLPISSFSDLKNTINNKGNYYGYLSYDLKNELENLQSQNPDKQHFDPIFFFSPEKTLAFSCKDMEYNEPPSLHFQTNWSKEKYIHTVQCIKNHIKEGDIYEMNFCIEFFSENVTLSPIDLYLKLNKISPTPFSSFIKNGNQYIISASPERFIKKIKNKVSSQPIKGTAKRHSDSGKDLEAKQKLYTSEKERAENLMIVDLVRNDLAKTALPGTVQVEELFGIYSFPQVHQMISTISAEVAPKTNCIDIIQSCYPMGSMTGAPKIMTMKLIEQYESAKRGVFSGAIGYITFSQDFDFNVVIRSLFYNAETQTLSFQVGSAITIDSIPEKEYEECMLKSKAIFSCFDTF